VDQEEGKERPRSLTSERDRTVWTDNLERPEDLELEH
jgi:hypothetical protein